MIKKLYGLIILFFLFNFSFAGTTGKISGKIIDATTGEPLIGANVIIKDSFLGASTDLDGFYVILNVPPGTYTLQVEYIGYITKEIAEVSVSIDLTTKIDIELESTTLEATETITVIAEQPVIKRDLTATTAVVGDEEIAALPVTEVSEVLSLQAGYVDGHMRGGRKGEIAYWIDGIPVTDAYDGSTVVDVNKDLVQELQVVSGAYNAEYGNAMSGIVNIVTKSGSNEFGGDFTVYAGDFLSNHDDIFWNISNFNPMNIYNFEGSLHGPIFKNKLFYYLNGRHIYFGGWLNGKRVYNPENIAYYDGENDEFVHYWREDGKGDDKYVSMNWNRKNFAQGKLIFKLTPTISLFSTTLYDQVDYEDYDRNYKLNPDGNLQKKRTGITQLFKMTHVLSPSTFYDFGITGFTKEYEEYAYKDPHDPRYVHPLLGQTQNSYSFKTGGVNDHRFKRKTQTVLAKFDFTSQLTRRNETKLGFEYRQHQMDFEDITLRPAANQDYPINENFPYIETVILPDCTLFSSHYKRKPLEASAYIQDKIEFENFILNLGVRFDYFDSDGYVLSDPTDPEIYNPIKPENINKSPEERRKYWYKDVKPKYQFSPRLGAAFPITQSGKIYISYGYFFQRPRYELLYENPDFEMPVSGSGVMGNADLKPEKTIQGEIGLQQQISDDIVVDATIYFRDVRDLTGTRAELISIYGSGRTYSRFINSDFGLVKGLILAIDKRFSNNFSAKLDYTYQVAKGTASNERDAFNAINAGSEPEVQLVPLEWDQTHTFNFSTTYAAEKWGASLIARYGSGLPYTPRSYEDISTNLTNRSLKPATYNVNIRLYSNLAFYGVNITPFLRILNLFDTLNETDVYKDSGKAGETIDEYNARLAGSEATQYVNTLDQWFSNANYYSEPRRVEFGVTVNF